MGMSVREPFVEGSDYQELTLGHEAVRIESTYSYENGFGHRISEKKCFLIAKIYQPDDRIYRGGECINAERMLRVALKENEHTK